MARKKSRFKNRLLEEPIVHRARPWYDPDQPPWHWETILHATPEQWREYVKRVRAELDQERDRRQAALWCETGIDPQYPRRYEQLLVWLMQRFEGGMTKEPVVFRRERINPAGEDAVKRLSEKLVRRHIPGFRERLAVGGRHGRSGRTLRAVEALLLTVTVSHVRAALQSCGSPPSDRALSKILRNLKKLSVAIGDAENPLARFLVMPDESAPRADDNQAWNRLWLTAIVRLHHRLAEDPAIDNATARQLRQQARELGIPISTRQRWLSESWLQKRIAEIEGLAAARQPTDFQRVLLRNGLEIIDLFRGMSES